MFCPKCESQKIIKNGMRHNIQCYKCKDCGYQYTKEKSRHSKREVKMAVVLYSLGFSFHTIAKMFEVSHNTIYLWVKDFSEYHYNKSPDKDIIEIEVGFEEICGFITEKTQTCNFGKNILEQINNFLSDAPNTTPANL